MRENILDLTLLSEEARKEVSEFYAFIKAKRPVKTKTKIRDLSELIPRKVPAFKPLSREKTHER